MRFLLIIALMMCASPLRADHTYALWNAADKDPDYSISGGGLVTSVDGTGSIRANVGKSAGKWYFEVTFTTAGFNESVIGVSRTAEAITNALSATSDGWGYARSSGNKSNGNITTTGGTSYGSAYGAGVVVGVAVDMDAGKIWFSRNGVWQGSGDPAAGAGAAYSNLSGTVFPAVGTNGGSARSWTANFGASAFAYSVPSGFSSGWYEPGEEAEAGLWVCAAVDESGECTEFVTLLDDIASAAELGISGEGAGMAFGFGFGFVLLFFGVGQAIGSVNHIFSQVLGGRLDS